jgi:hypothetical protein
MGRGIITVAIVCNLFIAHRAIDDSMNDEKIED